MLKNKTSFNIFLLRKLWLLVFILCVNSNLELQGQIIIPDFWTSQQFLYNPAHTGYNKDIRISALHSKQLIGFEGAPKTYLLQGDIHIKPWRSGFGAQSSYREVGLQKEFSQSFTYCFQVKTGENSQLSLGLSTEGKAYFLNTEDFIYPSEDLPIRDLPEEIYFFKPGLGGEFSCKNYFIGASIAKEWYIGPEESFSFREEAVAFLNAGAQWDIWKINVSSGLLYATLKEENYLNANLEVNYNKIFYMGIEPNFLSGSGLTSLFLYGGLKFFKRFQIMAGTAHNFNSITTTSEKKFTILLSANVGKLNP